MPQPTDDTAEFGNGVELDREPSGARHHSGRFLVRALARTSAVGFLSLTIFYGLMAGGHLEDPRNPLYGLPGQIAGYFGYAAQEIQITGLKHQNAENVLKAIGVTPDGPLFGFDARKAKRLLENIDWVERASLRIIHPNKLKIELVERVPFAIWQRGGARYVIDEDGIALSTLNPQDYTNLIVVTGKGAQSQAIELVNHMEGHPALLSKVKAAARVGKRRWTLYLDNGMRVALAEHDVPGSLARLMELANREGIFERAVEMVDLRLPGQTIVSVMPQEAGSKVIQISQR